MAAAQAAVAPRVHHPAQIAHSVIKIHRLQIKTPGKLIVYCPQFSQFSIATRYDKTDESYTANWNITAAIIAAR